MWNSVFNKRLLERTLKNIYEADEVKYLLIRGDGSLKEDKSLLPHPHSSFHCITAPATPSFAARVSIWSFSFSFPYIQDKNSATFISYVFIFLFNFPDFKFLKMFTFLAEIFSVEPVPRELSQCASVCFHFFILILVLSKIWNSIKLIIPQYINRKQFLFKNRLLKLLYLPPRMGHHHPPPSDSLKSTSVLY